ncbi:MAG: penicillin acylase family protein [Dermatophilaceae bacterium]
MSRARIASRIALAVVALIVVALVVGAGVGVSLVRQSFPKTSGQLTLSGLTAKVTVLRDDRGAPQIYADNPQDLFRAQGYVAAQDRFFEMDLRRHITAGRLSEMVGQDGVQTDRVIRTMGWRRVAEAELPTLDSSTRQYLQAYADGVNAYIKAAGSPDKMGLEYTVLGQKFPDYRVEPWSPADSLAWLKAMAWDLRGNYDNELTRARLAGRISPARLAQIFPPYPIDSHAPILSAQDWRPGVLSPAQSAASPVRAVPVPAAATGGKAAVAVYAEVAAALEQLPVMVGRGEGVGSNSWVVGPKRSSTGKPLLANDPHLGVSIPGVWYQTGLHCRSVSPACPFDVAGFSFAGLPGIVIGHNQSIAWGFTNLGPDVSDFYLEQLGVDTYRRGKRFLPLTEHPETIKVAGGKDVTITVRETVHGPLLSDVIPSVAQAGQTPLVNGKIQTTSYAVSLAWTGLLPGHTADAIFKIDTAQDFAQFRDGARDFAVPAQNLLYADNLGHIGYQAPGQVPVRVSSTAGAPPGYWPAPGWDAKYDWTGFVPFEEMPTAYDPPEGYIVAANQAVTASRFPFLTTEWDYGYRSERIRTLITATPKVTPARMSEIQADTRNEFAPELVKALLAVKLDDPFTEEAQDLLKTWNYTQPSGRSPSAAAAAFYNSVWSNILALTFGGELGDMKPDGGGQWMQAVSLLLKSPRDLWWDNNLTPGVIEGRDEILRQSMVEARMDLTRRLGKNPGTWQWGRLHQLTLEHKVLGGESVPDPVRALFNRGPWQMPGGSSIVNANGWKASEGYQVDWAPSMRMVVNLGDLDASTWVNQSGNSGHPYDAHYVDQADSWATNKTYPWPFSEKAVRAAGGDELTLTPDASGS